MSRIHFLTVPIILLFLTAGLLAQAREPATAWEALLQEDPAAVDDPKIDWLERLALHVLTPAQGRAYLRGAKAESLELQDGQTLSEYLRKRPNPPAGVFVTLPEGCELFGEADLLPGEVREVPVHQPCGIPEEATALLVTLRAHSPNPIRVKLWAADLPEPAEAVWESSAFVGEGIQAVTAVVGLCTGDSCPEGELALRSTDSAIVQGRVVGYFRTLRADDNPWRILPAATESNAGTYNDFVGYQAGENATGDYNAFYGREAGYGATPGVDNTADSNAFFGYRAGYSNTSGGYNAFIGRSAGFSNTSGWYNTFIGSNAGTFNTTGSMNTYVGTQAGYYATGSDNAFVGTQAGFGAIPFVDNTGDSCSYFGYQAGYKNTTGSQNTFLGYQAGYNNLQGETNSFVGFQAGYDNLQGEANAFVGSQAGYSNTSGSYNSFVGQVAGYFNSQGTANTFVGSLAGWSNTRENQNTFLGFWADLNPGSDPVLNPVTNATAVGHRAYVSQSNSLVLGSIAGVNSATDSVSVGIGTTAPSVPLHVKRTDGKAKLLVEEAGSPANRIVMELKNNGSTFFKFTNTFNGTSWTLNPLGTSFTFDALNYPGQELRLYDSGRLVITPSSLGTASFDLAANGDLMIAGNLTAAGFVYPSDREAKEDFEPVDVSEVLHKVARMEISKWEYKKGPDARHMGPMAQDFYTLFGLGADDGHLSPTDTAGVALAAIQGLYRELQEKAAEIAALRAELAEIRAMVGDR